MTKWEYCILNRVDECVIYLTVKGEEARGDRCEDIWEEMAKLGKEGWELVKINRSDFYFKRPLP